MRFLCFCMVLPLCVAGLSGAGEATRPDAMPSGSRASVARDVEKGPVMPEILKNVRRILFYGDSLTDGSSHPDYVVNTLNRVFPEAGFRLENSAKCGDRVADLLRRFDAEILPKKPDLVFINIGTNDVLRKVPTADFRKDYLALVDRILALPAKAVLVRPSHLGNGEVNEAFQAYLAIISEVGAARKCPVYDVNAAFLRWAAEGKKKLLGPDGIHFDEDGFASVARALLDEMGLRDEPLDLRIVPRPGTLSGWDISEPVDVALRLDPKAPKTPKAWKRFDPQPYLETMAWYDRPMVERGAVVLGAPQPAKTVTFARTTVEAEQDRAAVLEIGGWPQIAIWVNGELVFDQTAPHGYHPHADRVTVSLRKGKNEILLSGMTMAFVGIVP